MDKYMRTLYVIMWLAIIAAVLVITFKSDDSIIPDDSPIEELVERIIEHELGLPTGAIDLTPKSKECKE